MEFWIQKGEQKLQLSVKPTDYSVNVSHKNTTVNVSRLGDINLIGKTGLREISLSSFFPAQDYNFSVNTDRRPPKECVKLIEDWRLSDEPIRVIITDKLNMEATIESFSWGEQDATGDIYFNLALKEYKKPKIKSKSEEGSSRTTQPESTNSGKTYTVKSGDSLWKIAKQFYGNGSKYNTIYEANKDKLKNPNLIYVGQTLQIP